MYGDGRPAALSPVTVTQIRAAWAVDAFGRIGATSAEWHPTCKEKVISFVIQREACCGSHCCSLPCQRKVSDRASGKSSSSVVVYTELILSLSWLVLWTLQSTHDISMEDCLS